MINADPRHRTMALAGALTTLLLVVAACSSGTPSSAPASTQAASEGTDASGSAAASESAAASSAEGPTVTITGFSSFGTEEITVPAGAQLTVANNSGASHTFTEGENGGAAPDARVDETIAADASVTIDFPEPGDYNVTCLFHSSMNMVVHVE
jgi:plastocyanin